MIKYAEAYEWLCQVKNKKPLRFRHFKKLKNKTTGRPYSTKTLSYKLRGFCQQGLLKQELVKAEKEKAVVGYVITDKGLKVIEIISKCEQELHT